MKPKRIQLSRKRGFKLPPNTVVVSRPSKWGNPFIVGKHGTRAECVNLYRMTLAGYLCLSFDNEREQKELLSYAHANIKLLKGKHLACWCKGSPCHADVLLSIANAK